ncbi:ATP-binding cassette domain-containing protein [Sphaerisporangium fuscum]|uniref:ATP-binding cassette domain-containing protein n=1 Tax=Sphaerisporangium fuscum TaxID=2835868 RepID=UPI001BDC83CA|nr:ATP-binding cassette domain-containing protein [Sphaerisporangium fuscum]
MSYAIQVQGLVKRFGGTTALAGVDFEARAGTVLGLLGPNGAGKTTAVRILATLLRPDEGRATVGGYDTVRDAARVRDLIALTGQYASVDDEMSGTHNLVLIGRLLGLSRAGARQRARELLERFDVPGDRLAGTYSGGMRRRLDLAAGLVGRPEVLYLDEPTTGLDPRSRGDVWAMVRDMVAEGTTVLLTTQYLDEAEHLADEITVIDHGRVVADGTPDTLRAQIGGQTLELRPSEQADLGVVTAILTDLTGQVPEWDRDSGRLTVAAPDSGLLAALVRRLEEANVTVRELALRMPSLDEVFLALTGHRTTPPPEPTKET